MASRGADVLVVGDGPAGHAAAGACARAGLEVTLLGTGAPWWQTYGAWTDELADVGLDHTFAHRWTDTRVRTTGSAYRPLGRAYGLIDNDRLRAALADGAGVVSRMAGRAVTLEPSADRLVVRTATGERLAARAVVDATGQPPALAAPATRPRMAYQTAYGMVATLDRPPIDAGDMCLMDFDASPFAAPEPATFLYAMDLGAGRWFVEETCLARRPGLPLAVLGDRLQRRLAARGCRVVDLESTERCAFPMDPPLPPVSPPAPVVAFGAAAAMVHPATGYHVAWALRRADDLAAALAAALAEPGATPRRVAAAAADAVWPAALRRQHALHRLGLEVLLGLDAAATRRFFAAFFSLPGDAWRGYVSRTATTAQVQATMLRLLLALPPDVRLRLLRTVLRRPGLGWLARAVTAARR